MTLGIRVIQFASKSKSLEATRQSAISSDESPSRRTKSTPTSFRQVSRGWSSLKTLRGWRTNTACLISPTRQRQPCRKCRLTTLISRHSRRVPLFRQRVLTPTSQDSWSGIRSFKLSRGSPVLSLQRETLRPTCGTSNSSPSRHRSRPSFRRSRSERMVLPITRQARTLSASTNSWHVPKASVSAWEVRSRLVCSKARWNGSRPRRRTSSQRFKCFRTSQPPSPDRWHERFMRFKLGDTKRPRPLPCHGSSRWSVRSARRRVCSVSECNEINDTDHQSGGSTPSWVPCWLRSSRGWIAHGTDSSGPSRSVHSDRTTETSFSTATWTTPREYPQRLRSSQPSDSH